MKDERCNVLVVGSGAGGGTVAQRLMPLVKRGLRVLVLEQGPRLEDHEFNGSEVDMPPVLYEDGAGFLTADGSMTLAFGRAYGGSTVVYTGTSLLPPRRIIGTWEVPGLDADDLERRAQRYQKENSVHLLPPEKINENNHLFVKGCEAAGFRAEQFPVNVKGCRGSSLCNVGCPNGAKQGTNRVQLPAAEAGGVDVVTRATVTRIKAGVQGGIAEVTVADTTEGEAGLPSEWEPGEYRILADHVVLAGGSIGSSALLLRSGFDSRLPRIGQGFTCHPCFILVGEHPEPISNDVGHPKSFYVDAAAREGWLLETCMYFPFVTAKNLTGLGVDVTGFVEAFPRLQMILAMVCDEAVEENRIEVDSRGRPVVHYTFTYEVKERLALATRAAARIFFGAGALRVHAPLSVPTTLTWAEVSALNQRIQGDNFLPGRTSVSAAHLMGGCGMGHDAKDSVTDSWGRVHGFPWLRVADSSLFPNALEINPYLTVMALADRVAEGVLQEYGIS
ncbi:MAG: GMC family oxidoreductase [Gemmatimonadales bacterium]|nr:MAG: GMC family oxidoreductase [Gemmatimonadales bacterium]